MWITGEVLRLDSTDLKAYPTASVLRSNLLSSRGYELTYPRLPFSKKKKEKLNLLLNSQHNTNVTTSAPKTPHNSGDPSSAILLAASASFNLPLSPSFLSTVSLLLSRQLISKLNAPTWECILTLLRGRQSAPLSSPLPRPNSTIWHSCPPLSCAPSLYRSSTPERLALCSPVSHLLLQFLPDRALKCSAESHMKAIKSPAQPEAVLKFLSKTGLTDTQMKAAVLLEPRLLSCNVEKTLKPKVRQLIDAGFSGELLVELIQKNPYALCLNNTVSNVLFWRDFVGNNDQTLLKIIQRNSLLFYYSIDQHVLPRINLLKEYGLSNPDIVFLLVRGSRYMTQNLDSLRQRIQLIEELGILRGSTMFLCALRAVGVSSKDLIKRKVEFLRNTYKWTQEDVKSAFRKYPTVLSLSVEAIQLKMDFLVREAGFAPTSVASNPSLIGCSLERVLIPRNTVLRTLEAKGLKKICSLSTACKVSERSFRERYVVPFEKHVPGLSEAYVAAFEMKVLI